MGIDWDKIDLRDAYEEVRNRMAYPGEKPTVREPPPQRIVLAPGKPYKRSKGTRVWLVKAGIRPFTSTVYLVANAKEGWFLQSSSNYEKISRSAAKQILYLITQLDRARVKLKDLRGY
jgi:hypothetical protein